MWSRATGFDCGVCSQCRSPAAQRDPGVKPHAAQVFCIEPLPANVVRLNASAQRFGLPRRGFHVVAAAFTSAQDAQARGWSAQFPRQTIPMLAGVEEFGIDINAHCPRCPTERVPLAVLDRFVAQHRLPAVDFLSIDTEGNDPNVLRGGRTALKRVRYLEFEYHSIGAWRTTSLREVIRQLANYGFVCYWIGQAKVWRITDCWHRAYMEKRWSNVGCVQRREGEWYAIMEAVFHRTVPH
eukprot:EG_transcript_11728